MGAILEQFSQQPRGVSLCRSALEKHAIYNSDGLSIQLDRCMWCTRTSIAIIICAHQQLHGQYNYIDMDYTVCTVLRFGYPRIDGVIWHREV